MRTLVTDIFNEPKGSLENNYPIPLCQKNWSADHRESSYTVFIMYYCAVFIPYSLRHAIYSHKLNTYSCVALTDSHAAVWKVDNYVYLYSNSYKVWKALSVCQVFSNVYT